MIDWSKPGSGGGNAASSGPSLPTPPTLPGEGQINAPHTGEAPWDTLGRVLWGTGAEGGTLGQIPGVGDFMRLPGQAARAAVGVGGAGVQEIQNLVGAAAQYVPGPNVGDIPTTGTHVGGQVALNPVDPQRYPSSPAGGAALAKDIVFYPVATQFQLMGSWQEQNDPQAYQLWLKTLQEAQGNVVQFGPVSITGRAAEAMSRYVKQWAVHYVDQTPEGTQGFYDVMPELAYGGEGSMGQALADATSMFFPLGGSGLLQRHVEKVAAEASGRQGGALNFGSTWTTSGHPELGSRLDNLLSLPDEKLTEIEREAVNGYNNKSWTKEHVYDFLVSHGQGYSSDAVTQLVSSIALDPVMDATLIASGGSMIGERIAARGAESVVSANRVVAQYRAITKALGTTVNVVRDGPLGGSFRVARTLIDPLSALGTGPRAVAKTDMTTAVALKGTEYGVGAPAYKDAAARAAGWKATEKFDQGFGVWGANNVRKWGLDEMLDEVVRWGKGTPTTVIAEPELQFAIKNVTGEAKHVVARLATWVQKNREFYLTTEGQAALAERISKVVDRPLDEVQAAVKTMSRDEQAIWHGVSYSKAWSEFVEARNAIPQEAWGKLGPLLQDTVLLNPQELDAVAAKSIIEELSAKGLKNQDRIDLWNQYAGRYTMMDTMGKVTEGDVTALKEKLAYLQKLLNRGAIHNAYSAEEMAAVPAQFRRTFLAKWTDSEGNPIWRLGFKPAALDSAGLDVNKAGELYRAFPASVENVADAIPRAQGMVKQLVDPLGRVIPQTIKDSRAAQAAGKVGDSLDVLQTVARDRVQGARLINSMEQKFVTLARDAGMPEKSAVKVFKLSRDYAQTNTFTIAGMTADDFWRAAEPELKNLVDARVGKREIFQMLQTAAGGDMRLLGLTNWTAQRLRSALLAHGLNPNNYLGVVTVQAYNLMRYALNPLFFLQTELDAPWFVTLRGVFPDLFGNPAKVGTAEYRNEQILTATAHGALNHDLALDFTDRAATIHWQEAFHDSLAAMPGYKESLSTRFSNWKGRMVLNNERNFFGYELGGNVEDAIKTVQKDIEAKIAAATTPEEVKLWQDAYHDYVPMLDSLKSEYSRVLGREVSLDETVQRYVMEQIDAQRLEIHTARGAIDDSKLIADGNAYMPADVGELTALPVDHYVEQLGLPNINTANDLRKELAQAKPAYTLGNVSDRLKTIGYNETQIKRIVSNIDLDVRGYFDDAAVTLDMTPQVRRGVETVLMKEAKLHNMSLRDYMSQVLPITATGESKTALAAEARRAALVETPYAARGPLTFPVESTAKMMADGGATFDAATNTLADLKKGFAVGKHDLGGLVVDPTPEAIAQAYSEVSKVGSPYIGVDIRGGKAYVDPVEVVSHKETAITMGQVHKEHRVWDFAQAAKGNFAKAVVKTHLVPTTAGLDAHTNLVLKILRQSEKGEAGLDDMAALIADNLQPSMKARILTHFETDITAPGGLIEQAVTAGNEALAAELRQVAVGLKGGWGPKATQMYRDLVLKRAGVEHGVAGGMVSKVPEGFTTNPVEVLSGGGYAPGVKHEGFFHVTTAKDAVGRDGLKAADQLGVGAAGLGAKGDTNMIGRVALTTDRAIAQTMESRLKLAARAANGDATLDDVLKEMMPAFDRQFGAEADAKMLQALGGEVATFDTPAEVYAAVQNLDDVLIGADHVGIVTPFADAVKWDPEQITTVNVAVRKSRSLDYRVGEQSKGEFDLPAGDVRVIGTPSVFVNPEIERGVQFASQYLKEWGSQVNASTVLKDIVDNIPSDAGTPYDYTQKALMWTLSQNLRKSETTALRLANINPERSVLERSLNHPLFGMYPSSYFWGKVIPETFRFIAMAPFGIRTGEMAVAYYKVMQSIAVQSQYDSGLKDVWDKVGKSAVMNLLSYISPAFPYEDMRSNIPQWASSLASNPNNPYAAITAQMGMISPERWIRKGAAAAAEVGQGWQNVNPFTPQQQGQLQAISSQAPQPVVPTPTPAAGQLIQGTQLGPTLSVELQQLQQALSGK